jgi:hypothetical protein
MFFQVQGKALFAARRFISRRFSQIFSQIAQNIFPADCAELRADRADFFIYVICGVQEK